MNRFTTLALAASALVASASAQAAVTTYSSLSAFTAATTGVTNVDFEGQPTATSTWVTSAGPATFGNITVSQATPGSPYQNVFRNDPALASSYYYNWGTGDTLTTPYDGVLTITFASAVTAFSIDLGTFYGLPFPYPPGTVPGAATTRYGVPILVGTAQGNFVVNTNSTQTMAFFGVTSDTAFTSFTIRQAAPPLAGTTATMVLDNVRSGSAVAAAVPEPATWAMMIGGFGMIGFAMRRRRVRTSVSFA